MVSPRASHRFEIAVVAIVAVAYFTLGLGHYSLIDPWESHYAEVARRMLAEDDWVHTKWQAEGFRSKPVLTFWMMAASLRLHGLAKDGGYPGEMADRADEVTAALRLPFALFAALGVILTFAALLRLMNRRVAYLAAIAVATCPFYFLVGRQAITDMTLVGPLCGAIAMFLLATEDGERLLAEPLPGHRGTWWPLNAYSAFLLFIGGFLGLQAIYYVYTFAVSPGVARGLRVPAPGLILFAIIVVLWSLPWIFSKVRAIHPIYCTRQAYLLWFYALLGISVLGKGLPALGLAGVICLFYVALTNDWRRLIQGRYELFRGVCLIAAIVVPWHLAMFFRDGMAFANEYFGTHLFGRVAVGVFGERGTFNFYMSQLGLGLFVWAGLVPGALGSALRFADTKSRGGRVRLVYALWAITAVAFFSITQTKFHHYILPTVPPLAVLVAMWLDDAGAKRTRLHWLWVSLALVVTALLVRDLLHEEKQWVEMFIFRYDRPWPAGAPWSIDISDGLLWLLGVGAIGLASLWWIRRWPRTMLTVFASAMLGIALWIMHVYMPIAGAHWGQREALRAYYRERTIHGSREVYFGHAQLSDAWAARVGAATSGQDATHVLPTAVPANLVIGQPASVRIDLHSATDERKQLWTVTLHGTVETIQQGSVSIRLPAAEVVRMLPAFGQPLEPALATGKRAVRAPVRVVDADRLVVWNGYWRGEVFWSSDEIYGWLPEMKTDWQLEDSDGKKLVAYLSDRTLAPIGRTYYVITSANPSGLKAILPTARAKATLEVVDQSSNKFWLARFEL